MMNLFVVLCGLIRVLRRGPFLELFGVPLDLLVEISLFVVAPLVGGNKRRYEWIHDESNISGYAALQE